jgi:hypothetical protein
VFSVAFVEVWCSQRRKLVQPCTSTRLVSLCDRRISTPTEDSLRCLAQVPSSWQVASNQQAASARNNADEQNSKLIRFAVDSHTCEEGANLAKPTGSGTRRTASAPRASRCSVVVNNITSWPGQRAIWWPLVGWWVVVANGIDQGAGAGEDEVDASRGRGACRCWLLRAASASGRRPAAGCPGGGWWHVVGVVGVGGVVVVVVVGPAARGSLLSKSTQHPTPNSPGGGGARWTPLPVPRSPFAVRKCHQMPSKEHMQLGWVARWVLSTPPLGRHLAAGRCGRVVPGAPPLLLFARPARACPSVEDQRPPPAPR